GGGASPRGKRDPFQEVRQDYRGGPGQEERAEGQAELGGAEGPFSNGLDEVGFVGSGARRSVRQSGTGGGSGEEGPGSAGECLVGERRRVHDRDCGGAQQFRQFFPSRVGAHPSFAFRDERVAVGGSSADPQQGGGAIFGGGD